jgi:acyl-CoA synthetase (AMP-forming)/AMP-acid ligase II
MFIDTQLGNLFEPLTCRSWDRTQIYQELELRLVNYHKQGIRPSDRIFLLYGNRIEFFIDLMAVWLLGGVVIPIDARLNASEVENLAKIVKPKIAIYFDTLDEATHQSLSTQHVNVLDTLSMVSEQTQIPHTHLFGNLTLDQDALILFTSGTTGQPKGVVLTHRSLRSRWFTLKSYLGVERFRRTLCLLPTHFGHGLICNALFPWLSGQDLYIVPPFQSDLIMQLGKVLDENDITFMSSVPSVWHLACKASKRPEKAKLQSIFCASAPLSVFLWKQIQEWSGIKSVHNIYGITETSSWLAGTIIDSFEPEDGLIGVPWGTSIKIMKHSTTDIPFFKGEELPRSEPGFIWVNTPALMSRYYAQDDLTRKALSQGWFITGDIGCLDHRGYLYLTGRIREEINKGGMKIHPAEIDRVIEQFQGVIDVCCFGYEDALYGQNVGVAIVMKNKEPETVKNLFEWVKKHLAEHKKPARWYLLDAIPRTSRGKINREDVAKVCQKKTPFEFQ